MIDVEEEIRKACDEVGLEWDSVGEDERRMIEKCFRNELKRASLVRDGNKYAETYRQLAVDVGRRMLRIWLMDVKSRVEGGESEG